MGKKDENSDVTKSIFNNGELYHILFENAGEVIIFASNTQIIDCNIEALTLFEFGTKSDMIGRFFIRFQPRAAV